MRTTPVEAGLRARAKGWEFRTQYAHMRARQATGERVEWGGVSRPERAHAHTRAERVAGAGRD
jgi:hypothetical protein